MKWPEVTIPNLVGGFALLTLLGIALAALGLSVQTPSATFEAHLEDFDNHLEQYTEIVEGGEAIRELVEAQTRLTCLKTGADTLVMLNLTSMCIQLGVIP